MSVSEYRYELRHGDEVVATGHLTWEEPPQVGDRVTIAGQEGVVRTVEPTFGQHEWRLVVQVSREGADS